MPNQRSNPSRGPVSPNTIIYSFYIASIFLCTCALVLFIVINLDRQTYDLSSWPESRVTVGSSDMLGIELTLSGISIPLAISYLLSRSKELQTSIHSHVVYLIGLNGLRREELNQAKAIFDDNSNKFQASEAFSSITELLSYDSPESDTPMSDVCLRRVFNNTKLQNAYKKYFESGQDREVMSKCITFVAVPAVLLIIDLIVRFVGLRGALIDMAELALFVSSACANLTMYCALWYVVRLKIELKDKSKTELANLCLDVTTEVKNVLLYIQTRVVTVSADIQQAAQEFNTSKNSDK